MSERRQGPDGKLYFHFNRGAEYKFSPQYCSEFTHKITACEFDEKTGKEFYRIESDGKKLPTRFCDNQITLMLAQFSNEQTAAGEPVELPLLAEEVKAFFAAKRKEVHKANVAANNKIKGTAWNGNLQKIAAAQEELRFVRANGNAVAVAELEKKLEELRTAQEKILAEKGVDLKVLTKTPDCPLCKDEGIKNGKICACALAIADKIKAYNAEIRLSRS